MFVVIACFWLLAPTVALADTCCKCSVTVAPNDVYCLTGPEDSCSNLMANSTNSADVKGKVTCSEKLTPAQCKIVAEGGMCKIAPATASAFVPPTSANPQESTDTYTLTTPKLNVPIPGLTLSEDIKVVGGEKVQIPYLAQYIAGIYRYIIALSVVAAAIMITYGGFLYIVGGTFTQVKKGTGVIKDAIAGLFIVFAAYIILFTLNENLLKSNQALSIDTVKKDQIQLDTVSIGDYWTILSKNMPQGTGQMTGKEKAPSSQQQATVPGQAPAPPANAPKGNKWTADKCTFDLNQFKLPTQESIYKCAIKIAQELGVEPCIAVVIINNESWAALPNAVGYDENAPNGIPRLPFLRSGKYSYPKDGSNGFSPPPGIPPECGKAALKAQGYSDDAIVDIIDKCDTARNSKIYNNDAQNFDPTKDDLGLTWGAYSRGVGLMQTTIFGKSSWCQGSTPSAKIGTECFTAGQLVNPEVNIRAGLLEVKANMNLGLEGMYKAWNQSKAYNQRLVAQTQSCMTSGRNPLEFMKSTNICRGDVPLSKSGCKEEAARRKEANKTAAPDDIKASVNCDVGCYDPRYPVKQSMIAP